MVENATTTDLRRIGAMAGPSMQADEQNKCCASYSAEIEELRAVVEWLRAENSQLGDHWDDIAHERNNLKAEIKRLRAALALAHTGLLAAGAWLTPNVGGWSFDMARDANEKTIKLVGAALQKQKKAPPAPA
jgi:hypothetical protein